MGHFMGQKSQMGQKFVPKFIRENNTARKIQHFWAKKVVQWAKKVVSEKFLSHAQTVAAQGFQGFLGQKTTF